jgi:hypothetical protein
LPGIIFEAATSVCFTTGVNLGSHSTEAETSPQMRISSAKGTIEEVFIPSSD